MRASIWIWVLSATLTLPLVATAEGQGSASDAPPAATTPPAAAPAPARGIQPTVTRLPSYWQCQDNLDHRLVVTYLDTQTPSVVLARGGKTIIATLKGSKGVGAKYMASGGILFWERGREATLQWGSANATSCSSLGS